MIRFKIREKFEGLNEDGLTHEQFIRKDVRDLIAIYPSLREADLSCDNNIVPAPSSNIHFALSHYYYKYLDILISAEQAKILKDEIIKCVGSESELFQFLH